MVWHSGNLDRIGATVTHAHGPSVAIFKHWLLKNAIYALLTKMRCVGGPSQALAVAGRAGLRPGRRAGRRDAPHLVVLGDEDGVGWTVEGLE